jgi:MFS family permease
MTKTQQRIVTPAVIVAALGYFVDIYDLLLFSIVRKASLESLGFSGAELESNGILLLNLQMAGMLIGGVLWGVLGDKKGRLSVLFGSIFLYSVANVANGFVGSIESYGFWRFVAGIGLAGELGAGITLVTEIMPKETRGYGTTIVASIGIAGAVVGGVLADIFDWRTCYFIGGGLGLALLLLRVGVTESGMYAQVQEDSKVEKGNFLALFTNWKLFGRYLGFICIGLPIWYVVGILVTFSPELGALLGTEGIKAGKAVMFCYGGMVIGDILSGVLSQVLKSRKKVLWGFWILALVSIVVYFGLSGVTVGQFYAICLLCGIGIGSWVVFMTAAAEQFGTNIRATVTTTVPNFVRGAVIPMTSMYAGFATINGLGSVGSAMITGTLVMLLAAWGIHNLKETFGENMDFTESV